MATNSPAATRKPLRVNRSRHPKSAYKTIEVTCLDLAKLLDWIENSTMPGKDGIPVSILDVPWYRDAYRSIELAFWSTIGSARRWGK